jgi:hypothetical protein
MLTTERNFELSGPWLSRLPNIVLGFRLDPWTKTIPTSNIVDFVGFQMRE